MKPRFAKLLGAAAAGIFLSLASGPAWSNQIGRGIHSAPAMHAPAGRTGSVASQAIAIPTRLGLVAGNWKMASVQPSQGNQAKGPGAEHWPLAHHGDGDHDADDRFAHHHRHHEIVIVGPVFFPPPVFESTIAVPAGTSGYTDQFTPPGMAPGYWYYCDDAQAYYPYVGDCPNGWRQVVPQPPR